MELEPESRLQTTQFSITEITNTVQPVGFAYPGHGSSLFQTKHPSLIQSSKSPLVMPHMMTTTPAIQLPGRGPQQVPAASSAAVHSASGSGYTTNHLSYNMTRQSLASNAYALHGGHVIVVEVRAVHMPIGKFKPQLIGVSLKSINK